MILPSFLAIALFLTRNAVLVSSFGCVLSLFLVVVGHEHVRGPIGILSWYAYRAGLTDAVIEIVVMSALPVGGMLTSGVLPNMRGRFVLSSLAAIGMLAVWCYWTFNSMFLGWEYLASVPLFVCLGWRFALEASNVLPRRPT